MSAIPLDFLSDIIDISPLCTVNILARTCRYLANYVRDRALARASPHTSIKRAHHKTYSVVAQTLPNGTRHGSAKIMFGGTTNVSMEYSLGVPSHWQVNYGADIFWGKVGSPYMIHCPTWAVTDKFYSVVVDIGIHRIKVRTSGDKYANSGNGGMVSFENGPSPLTGYLIDNKIQPAVIDPWIVKVAYVLSIPLGPLTRNETFMFDTAQLGILHSVFGNEFDHLYDLLDGI